MKMKFDDLVKKSLGTKWKSFNRSLNLKYIDDLLNGFHGKAAISFYGDGAEKVVTKCNEYSIGGVLIHDGKVYGHINILPWNRKIRLNTNLDIKNNSVQFPYDETPHLRYGDYIMFTNGDIVVTVPCKELLSHIEGRSIIIERTNLNNYEIPLSELFRCNLVDRYGLIDTANELLETDTGLVIDLKAIQLSSYYLLTSSRGCLSSLYGKYIKSRIQNADNENFYEYYIFPTLKDVLINSHLHIKTTQGLGNYVKETTKDFYLDKPTYNSKFVINQDKNTSYLFLENDANLSMEEVRLYTAKFIKPKAPPKKYNIHWAVKKCVYCKSNAEYKYFKEKFIGVNGIKLFYTDEDLEMFRLAPIQDFKGS